MAESTFLKCVVVTPERAVLDEPADFVALPMYDGELGGGAGEKNWRKGNNLALCPNQVR